MTNTVFLTVLIAVAAAEARLVAAKKPMDMRPVVGGFLAGIFLLVLAAISERFAKMFCLLVILGAILAPLTDANGQPLRDNRGNIVHGGRALINALTPKK